MKRRLLIAVLAMLTALTLLGAQGAPSKTAGLFSDAERLFRDNKPREAIPILERAVSDPQVDPRAFLYLAVSYQQIGKIDEGIAVLRRGIPRSGNAKSLFLYNMGNLYVLQGKSAFAEETYSQAIDLDPNYAPAYLNRANARLSQGKQKEAQADYSLYLALEPQAAQRPAIEALLAKLGAAMALAEQKAAEAAAKKAAEEEAKQRLLSEIAASLKAAAEETTSLSAGSGEVEGYGDELPLEE